MKTFTLLTVLCTVLYLLFCLTPVSAVSLVDQPVVTSIESKLREKQKKLEEEVGLPLLSAPTIEIDWSSFADAELFTSKSDGSRKSVIESVVNDIVQKGLFASDTGFVAWCKKSPVRARTALLTAIGKIVVQLAIDNKVDHKEGNSYYGVRYSALERTLYVTARLDSVSYTDGWGPKIDKELDLNVLDEVYMNDATFKLKEKQVKFDFEVKDTKLSAPPIEIDWSSFVTSQVFKSKSDGSRKSIVDSVVSEIIQKGLFASDTGLVAWCKKSSTRARVILLGLVSKIVVRLTTENKIESRFGNSYYRVDYNNTEDGGSILFFTARMDSVSYTDGWGPKVDEAMDLHVLDEVYIRAAEDKIKEHQTKLNAEFKANNTVLLEVDWDSFVRHPTFLSKSDGSRKSIIEDISSQVIQKGIHSSDSGLKRWVSESARVKRIFLERVNKILIKLSPESKIESGPGNSYYSIALDNHTLVVLARLDSLSYTDGWGIKVDNALDLHFHDELNIKSTLAKVAKQEATLRQELAPLKPKLVIDWASFVHHPTFLTKSDGTRKNNIEELSTYVLQKGLFASDNGLVYFYKSNPGLKLAAVVLKAEPTSKLESGPGNSYYNVAVRPGPTVIATVRLDSLSYTDGWKTKLNAIIDQIKAAPEPEEGKEPEDLPQVHEYLLPQADAVQPAAAEPLPTHEYLLPAPLEALLAKRAEEHAQRTAAAAAAAQPAAGACVGDACAVTADAAAETVVAA